MEDEKYEFVEGEAAYLSADRVEAGQEHSLRGVVDDQVDPGDRLESADVAPFAADDAALEFVVGQV